MPGLFESTFIKKKELTNRFVRSATWEGLAYIDGSVTPRLIDVSAKLSPAGVLGLSLPGTPMQVLKDRQYNCNTTCSCRITCGNASKWIYSYRGPSPVEKSRS